jgi:hypothetical protein
MPGSPHNDDDDDDELVTTLQLLEHCCCCSRDVVQRQLFLSAVRSIKTTTLQQQ